MDEEHIKNLPIVEQIRFAAAKQRSELLGRPLTYEVFVLERANAETKDLLEKLALVKQSSQPEKRFDGSKMRALIDKHWQVGVFAEAVGISRRMIRKYELGAQPDQHNWNAIANLLGVPPEDLEM